VIPTLQYRAVFTCSNVECAFPETDQPSQRRRENGVSELRLPLLVGGVALDRCRPKEISSDKADFMDEIVRRVEALFKLADAIEQRVAMATERSDKLTQSILAKAFRGKLVPTEAELARREGREYEPASAILARIRTNGLRKDSAKLRLRGSRAHSICQ
jgi:hypothetical protein